MAKKRKTRQEKISATLRHNENPVTYSLFSFKKLPLINSQPPTIPTDAHNYDANSYQSIRHDLIKTSAITGAIILTELALFFVLR